MRSMPKAVVKKSSFRYTKLKNSEIRSLITYLTSEFGDDSLDFLSNYSFYKTSSNKLYIFSGNLVALKIARINSLGTYFGTFHDERFRLSIEGSKFINPKKNVIVLDDNSFKSYICAENLFLTEVQIFREGKPHFLVVKFGNENLGSVSIKDDMILTYVPKSRKLDFNKVF